MDDKTIRGYQLLIHAAVDGYPYDGAQDFYITAMAQVYHEVKQRTGYELCPHADGDITIHQHGELLGGYSLKEETEAMYPILVELNPKAKKSAIIFIDKAAEALLEIIKKHV